MNIEELRSARERLEINLLQQLIKFKSDTGLSIVDCDIRYVTTSQFGVQRRSIDVTNVFLKTEPI